MNTMTTAGLNHIEQVMTKLDEMTAFTTDADIKVYLSHVDYAVFFKNERTLLAIMRTVYDRLSAEAYDTNPITNLRMTRTAIINAWSKGHLPGIDANLDRATASLILLKNIH